MVKIILGDNSTGFFKGTSSESSCRMFGAVTNGSSVEVTAVGVEEANIKASPTDDGGMLVIEYSGE
jgi:hypothetical protein